MQLAIFWMWSIVVTDAVAKSDIYVVKLGLQDQVLAALPAAGTIEEDKALMISLRGSSAGGASLNFRIDCERPSEWHFG